MPAFKPFGPGDQLDNVLILQPEYNLTSGSQGWRGSPEVSSSLSLHGGFRRTGIVRTVEYQSHNPIASQVGNPIRSAPMTASVHDVWLVDSPLSLTQRNDENWDERHWNVIMDRLYDDYAVVDHDYHTASYDYYSLYFQRDSQNIVVCLEGRPWLPYSSSFTFENWAKPFQTQSLTNDFTLQSVNTGRGFWWGITGSTGRLVFSSSVGVVSSSFGPSVGSWHHCAVSWNKDTQSGSFYIDLQHAGDFTLPAVLTYPNQNQFTTIGNVHVSTVGDFDSQANYAQNSGVIGKSFYGLLGESRAWNFYKDWVALSASYNVRLSGSQLSGSVPSGSAANPTFNNIWGLYFPFKDGPLAQYFTDNLIFSNWIPTPRVFGSGTLSPLAVDQTTGFVKDGNLTNFAILNGFSTRLGPMWHPNDSTEFFPAKARVPTTSFAQYWPNGYGTSQVTANIPLHAARVISIPAAMFGRQIVPESVRMVCRAFETGSYGLIRTLVDDGRGGLYISGSVFSGSTGEESSVGWNKVGNVFYGEGLIVIKDPSLFDFGKPQGLSYDETSTFQLSFRGESRIPVKTLMCRVDRGEFNATLNPTFREEEDDGDWTVRHVSSSVYVSTVGLYNSDRELVGVARLAEPLRLRSKSRFNIKLRMDF